MPRKKTISEDEYNEIFPARLRLLIDEKQCRQEDIAQHLGVTRQAVSCYINGQTRPDWKSTAALADYFGVSADYLLGLSNDRQRLPCAADELGLNEKTIAFLNSLDEASKYIFEEITDNFGIEFKAFLLELLFFKKKCENASEFVNEYLADDDAADEKIRKLAADRYSVKKILGNAATLVDIDRDIEFRMYEVENSFRFLLEKMVDYQSICELMRAFREKQMSLESDSAVDGMTVLG